ncbi:MULTISPECIES: hypothetical protein [unclassified Halomonas]|uniref:hypothetical protein n=1 Tax=unclassified Halomonas TaxID=2609666 RepID=UPI000B1BB24E|nr:MULTISPECIES: hypothetical protein [unclassified Halomonas]
MFRRKGTNQKPVVYNVFQWCRDQLEQGELLSREASLPVLMEARWTPTLKNS